MVKDGYVRWMICVYLFACSEAAVAAQSQIIAFGDQKGW